VCELHFDALYQFENVPNFFLAFPSEWFQNCSGKGLLAKTFFFSPLSTLSPQHKHALCVLKAGNA
jgi:hypothetical protein